MPKSAKEQIIAMLLTVLFIWACGPAAAAVQIKGQVQGGGGPIANSTVTLWAASANAPSQLAQVQTVARTQKTELKASSLRCPSQKHLELVVYARGGLTQPCCSLFAGYKVPALRLADWRHHTVADLRDQQLGDPFFLILREHGFQRIYEIVRAQDPDLYKLLPAYGSASSVCHFCSIVMGGPLGARVRLRR